MEIVEELDGNSWEIVTWLGESVEQIANRLVVGRAADQLLASSAAGMSLESFSSLKVHMVTEDRRSWCLNRLTGGTALRYSAVLWPALHDQLKYIPASLILYENIQP